MRARARAAERHVLTVEAGRCLPLWAVRLGAALLGGAGIALMAPSPGYAVLAAIGLVLTMLWPRTTLAGAFPLAMGLVILLASEPLTYGPVAGAVLAIHVVLAATTVGGAGSLRTLVPLSVMRSHLPSFALIQIASQAIAALGVLALSASLTAPWAAAAAVLAVGAVSVLVTRGAKP